MTPLSRLRYRMAPGPSGSTGSTGTSTGPVDIASVSGTFTDGQTITVSGANLMSASTAGMIPFFQGSSGASRQSFEGATPAGDGYSRNGSTYSSVVSLFGGQSQYSHTTHTGAGSDCPIDNEVAHLNFQANYNASGHYFVRAYGRWNATNWPNYWKYLQFFQATMLFQPANAGPQNPSNWILDSPSESPSPIRTAANPWGTLENNRWYCTEVGADFGNRLFSAWVDGQQIFTDEAYPNFASSLISGFFLHGSINNCSTTFDYDCENWIDGLTISSAGRVYPACLVYLADSSNYDTANKVYQPPLKIGDTQVQFVFNSTGIRTDGSTVGLTGLERWVFVINNAQERSSGHQVA